MESVATPRELRVAEPSSVEPLKKLTVPDAVVALVTVAVRVNDWPAVTGFGDATRPVLVPMAAGSTVTDVSDETLPRKPALPKYFAVRSYLPTTREEVASVATPEEFKVAEPSIAGPLKKLTTPFGIAELMPVTIAVRVSVWLVATGFGDATRLVVVAISAGFTITAVAGEVLPRKPETPGY